MFQARRIALASILLPALYLQGQVTTEDYRRAEALRRKYQDLVIDMPGPANWIAGTDRFWYTKTVKGGRMLMLVDAAKATKRPAFDHEKLAAALNAASGQHYTALALPIGEMPAGLTATRPGAPPALSRPDFVDDGAAVEFAANGAHWHCALVEYTCKKIGDAADTAARRPAAVPEDLFGDDPAPAEFSNDVIDGISGLEYALPQQGQARGGRANAQTQSNSVSAGFGPMGGTGGEPEVRTSPDAKWDALIRNYNVYIRRKGGREAWPLSQDGVEGNYYTLQSVVWSPDSKHLVAYRTQPGYRREVHYVESSPPEQLQPKHYVREYAKPGDPVDIARPVLFDIEERRQTVIDNSLFPNPYSLSRAAWWKDSRAFTFTYNQRGHQVFRLVEVNAETGKARAIITEQSSTFVDYRPLIANRTDTGKIYRHDVNDGKEIVWASERDGWEHLYLFDGATGELKNRITRGAWVVRGVESVDDEKRQVVFLASGMDKGKDPYFVQYFRVNFDGTGLTRLTREDGNHAARFSPDGKFFVDTWSRVDSPPMSVLRRSGDGGIVMELEKTDITAAVADGYRTPEPFAATGRDGTTEIWGVIYRPARFDPAKKYPVVETIYAGPQGSFVPKDFAVTGQPLTELGFVVVQIDGMGTNNRSKAFHDVAWHNLADAGFADRILWHKAAAAKYPWYDIGRVGVFGTSAGGQNAMAALLFHPEFYKAAVSNSGCHDNRMDKIWWNEQWMGWPLGPQYSASSNVDNAYRLEGKLLLIAGELDTNVDPSSTFQVVNQLIRHNEKFDLLFVPGGGHGAGGAYGQRLLDDFFVHNLLGAEPPAWPEAAPEEQP